MASLVKTVIATGGTSGLGFEAVKLLLTQSQPYRFILGARDTAGTQAAFDQVGYDKAKHSLSILPLELSDLKGVRTFAQRSLESIGQDPLDILFLNAAVSYSAEKPGANGSKWCNSYLINHLSQHYLIHLLREKLVASKSRVVVVSSGAVRNVPDPSVLDAELKSGHPNTPSTTYAQTKFVQLLGAHWWRRQLQGQVDVVAVSPGYIPATGLGREGGVAQPAGPPHPDAKSVVEGGENVLRAFTRDDFPADPEQIFLTSWGEWWPSDVYKESLDKALQDKWSPSKEEIEREEKILE